jgi:AcrR family transcriptional regulator
MTSATRLPAAERREALLEVALRVFEHGSYRGTTITEIAHAAGVSEPVVYRHFASKRDLYLAAIDEAWRRLRAEWDAAIAAEPDPRAWIPTIARSFVCGRDATSLVAELWMQATVEAADDAEVRRWLRRHMRDVHGHVAGLVRSAQSAGAVDPERDPEAEAWIFLAGGLLGTVGRRLGGLLSDEDFDRVRAARRAWMLNEPTAPTANAGR